MGTSTSKCTNYSIELQYTPCYPQTITDSSIPSCSSFNSDWKDVDIQYDCVVNSEQGKRRRCSKETCIEEFAMTKKSRDNLVMGIIIFSPFIAFFLVYIYNTWIQAKK